MKCPRQTLRGWKALLFGVFLGLAGSGEGWGQATGEEATTPDYLRERRVLGQEQAGLLGNWPENGAMEAWKNARRPRLAAQEQWAVRMGRRAAVVIPEAVEEVEVPAGGTPTLENYLVARAQLWNARREMLQRAGARTWEQVEAVEEDFEGRTAGYRREQDARAEELAQEAAMKPPEAPAATAVSPELAPEVRAQLAERDRQMQTGERDWNAGLPAPNQAPTNEPLPTP